MTVIQRRRSATTLATLEAMDHHTTQLALATPAIDVIDLAAWFRVDKLAAAEALAALDAQKLLVQAIAYTTWLNERYSFSIDDVEAFRTEDVLANFERGIAVYRASRVEA